MTEDILRIARQGCFHIGGHYVETRRGRLPCGQMFVQFQEPAGRRHAAPIVMVHGAGQTGTNYLCTPDGRPGWAEDALRAGWAVYVVDQPGRGRSGQFPELYGEYGRTDLAYLEQQFTAVGVHRLWPQAARHAQWPGGPGQPGNAAFDQFFATQVAGIADPAANEALAFPALLALLERIGPAVLLTHSQSGVMGWKLADERPELVRAIIAVEPNGPPLHDIRFKGGSFAGEDWYAESDSPGRAWGITRLPLHFEPPAESPTELHFEREAEPDAPGLVRCWVQQAPARRLPRLAGIPIAVVTGEASYRATYDHCTVKFLRQAGASAEHIRLEEHGLPGNGHMLMLEANSAGIAALLLRWLEDRLGTRPDEAGPAGPAG